MPCFLCVTGGGPEGLEIAIDVLSQFGSLTAEYALEFWKRDHERWKLPRQHTVTT